MRAAGILLLILALANMAMPAGPQKPKRNIKDLKSKLHAIQQRKHEVKTQIQKTKRELHSVLGDIHAVDARLEKLEDAVAATEENLQHSRVSATRAAKELMDATAKMHVQRANVASRLKRVYMQGEPTFLSALAGANSVGDIAQRGMLVTSIEKKDRAALDEYISTRRLVATKKKEADDLVVRIQGLIAQQHAHQQELAAARKQKESYVGELNGRIGELKELASQFDQDEAEITGQIQAYIRENSRPTAKPGIKLKPFGGGRFSRPVNASMTSGFGMRYHPILHYSRLHAGVDFGAPTGTPIHAAADGVVIASQRMSGFGNVVILDHGGGYATVYGHCSRLLVSSGQHVSRGQVIAKVGSTGLSTGPHLHFEVRINGRPVNPVGRF